MLAGSNTSYFIQPNFFSFFKSNTDINLSMQAGKPRVRRGRNSVDSYITSTVQLLFTIELLELRI
jgi:hypothetical protein